jgi:phosphatidylglycerophosphatase A
MNAKTEPNQRKPHLALAIATGLGLGYLPKAPGTWGSLLGVVLAGLVWLTLHAQSSFNAYYFPTEMGAPRIAASVSRSFALEVGGLAILSSLLGLWAAGRAAMHLQKKDPQIVVIDEVAGQLLTYVGLAVGAMFAVNWQYLLAGFILFRAFDIWKPFPARLAESFPGGVGIMADDWIAGLYAALALALARQLGF